MTRPTGSEVPPCIQMDALDRDDFERVMERSAALSALAEKGARLLADFRALLRDVFAAHAKAVVAMSPLTALPRSAALRHRLVTDLIADDRYIALQRVTQLQPDKAGLATLRVGRALYAELKAGRLMLPRELRDQAASTMAERDAGDLNAEAESAQALADASEAGSSRQRTFQAEADALTDAAEEARTATDKLERALKAAADQVPGESIDAMRGALSGLAERLEDSQAEALPLPMEGPAAGAQGGDGSDAIAAMDLSEQLANNTLLAHLARLIGALQLEARAARRERVPRAKTEVFGLTQSADLARLLPQELAAMSHPVLRRDFHRRFIERQLMTYRMRGQARDGRGPAVVCLDVSGSMMGAKAIWAKAIALTLADLARRQKRAVTVLTFSSGASNLREHSLVRTSGSAKAARPRFGRGALLTFAQQQVGGGTDFEPPLRRAQEIIEQDRRFDRGDIVFITDGEARVGAATVEAFAAFKRARACRAVGIVIDVASHQTATLAQICDSVVQVSDLNAKNARAVFAAFDG